MIIWGEPIKVDGVRPVWLGDDVRVCGYSDCGHYTYGIANDIKYHARDIPWSWIIAKIQIPADHFAYLAIAKGFEPWGGGDCAPDDWDGGGVLARDGQIYANIYRWSHGKDHHGNIRSPLTDIIGYKKKEIAMSVEQFIAPVFQNGQKYDDYLQSLVSAFQDWVNNQKNVASVDPLVLEARELCAYANDDSAYEWEWADDAAYATGAYDNEEEMEFVLKVLQRGIELGKAQSQ